MNSSPSLRLVRTLSGTVALFALGLFSTIPARADTPVSGTYVINGKPVQLKYARVIKGEPFSDKETTVVILTEKDASKSKSPENDTMFGKLGGGLILTITSDGELVGTQVVKDKVQFSASGNIKLTDYKAGGDNVTGKVATDGQQKFFETTWQIDVSFSAAGA
jgi:hypothetical protein